MNTGRDIRNIAMMSHQRKYDFFFLRTLTGRTDRVRLCHRELRKGVGTVVMES